MPNNYSGNGRAREGLGQGKAGPREGLGQGKADPMFRLPSQKAKGHELSEMGIFLGESPRGCPFARRPQDLMIKAVMASQDGHGPNWAAVSPGRNTGK